VAGTAGSTDGTARIRRAWSGSRNLGFAVRPMNAEDVSFDDVPTLRLPRWRASVRAWLAARASAGRPWFDRKAPISM
jgi:hypothetical protein